MKYGESAQIQYQAQTHTYGDNSKIHQVQIQNVISGSQSQPHKKDKDLGASESNSKMYDANIEKMQADSSELLQLNDSHNSHVFPPNNQSMLSFSIDSQTSSRTKKYPQWELPHSTANQSSKKLPTSIPTNTENDHLPLDKTQKKALPDKSASALQQYNQPQQSSSPDAGQSSSGFLPAGQSASPGSSTGQSSSGPQQYNQPQQSSSPDAGQSSSGF
ncbi:unnamed protein product, partial [Trichobilharzia regenti]